MLIRMENSGFSRVLLRQILVFTIFFVILQRSQKQPHLSVLDVVEWIVVVVDLL
jgi:hypothetical protein